MCYGASTLLVAHCLLPCLLAKLTVMGNHSTLNSGIVWGNPDHECMLCYCYRQLHFEKFKKRATTVSNPEGVFMATLKICLTLKANLSACARHQEAQKNYIWSNELHFKKSEL